MAGTAYVMSVNVTRPFERPNRCFTRSILMAGSGILDSNRGSVWKPDYPCNGVLAPTSLERRPIWFPFGEMKSAPVSG